MVFTTLGVRGYGVMGGMWIRRVKCGVGIYVWGVVKTFNDKTGTLLHYSRLSLLEIVLLFIVSFYFGLPFRRFSESLRIGYGTVYKASRRIASLVSSSPDSSKLSGVVELDETFVTAGLKGRGHRELIRSLGRMPRRRGLSRRGRGNYYSDRVPVMILVSRDGDERYSTLITMSSEEVKEAVRNCVEGGSTIYTDEYPSYNILDGMGYVHESVNHSKGEYVRGDVHINNCENRAGLLKRFLRPRNGISKTNTDAYIRLFHYHRRISKMSFNEAIIEAIRV